MRTPSNGLGDAQHRHWDHTYDQHPVMYGPTPSDPGRWAADLFSERRARTILELGAGHGRDSIHFARTGAEQVYACDISAVAIDQLRRAVAGTDLDGRLAPLRHDARQPIPLPDQSVDAVYAHMLFCMALRTTELEMLMAQTRRVLRPGGVLIYTVRHTGDAHYRQGIAHGDDIWEHSGFAVHYFTDSLVRHLAAGWNLDQIHPFEEGDLPRHLWRVTQTTPNSAAPTASDVATSTANDRFRDIP